MANTKTNTVGLGLPPGVLAGLVHLRGLARAARERSESVEAACSWIDAIESGLEAPLPDAIDIGGDAVGYIRELQDRNARLKRRVADLQELVQELETNE